MKISTKALHKAHGKYQSEIGNIEQKLTGYIDFDFGVLYQPSDGFVIYAEVSKYGASNAPLDSCLKIIADKGKLTEQDYLSNCI